MRAAEWVEPELLDCREICIDYMKSTREGFTPSKLKSCHGDLVLICNALMDYADICDAFREREQLEGFAAATYEYYANRFREIAAKYGGAIGYDREKTIERCRKRQLKADTSDVGEEALTMLVNRGTAEARKKAHEKGGQEA